ncbi:MAG: hypothetical protein IT356_13000, partial [Gemmatimonadaceae bacterium]|nr:hypothetical protein [Gemmatimonadaceae bacterium]
PPEDDYEVEAYNAAAHRLARLLPPGQAARLAPAAAEAVDGRIAALPEDLLDRLSGDDSPVNLWRAAHRGEHVDELERLLGR